MHPRVLLPRLQAQASTAGIVDEIGAEIVQCSYVSQIDTVKLAFGHGSNALACRSLVLVDVQDAAQSHLSQSKGRWRMGDTSSCQYRLRGIEKAARS
jgi:hypothetical protein